MLRKLLKNAEEKFYVNKLDSINADIKRSWRIINNLLGKRSSSLPDEFTVDNIVITDPSTICEKFSNYFVEHPQNIHSSVPPSQLNYSHLIHRNPNSATFSPCTDVEIKKYYIVNEKGRWIK